MARKWSGFLPQNQDIKEEWELLEACEAQARLAEKQHPLDPNVQPPEPALPSGPRAHKPK